MKKKHLQTNFFKFLLEKYKEEIQDLETQITPEETNLNDEDLVDEIDEIDDDKSTKKEVQKEFQKEDENDEVPDEKLIERIFNLISKNKKKTNGNIRRR
jgi:hypothetical protein